MSKVEEKFAWGMKSDGEARWPASTAIMVAIALYLVLPGKFTLGPPWVIPALELGILLPLSLSAPQRVHHEENWKRIMAVVSIAVVNVANLASLVLLVYILVYHRKPVTGPELLFSSLCIWVTNVIVFSLWYWEIDRGGPHKRQSEHHPAPDFLFPQMSNPGCTTLGWAPKYLDYLYLAFTNATAFSPTDVMPLTQSAKLLMLIQSVISLVTITLVAARAVNILS